MNKWDGEEILKKEVIEKKRKAGKLKPAQQRHNQKQMKVWQTKVPQRGER